MASIKLSSTSLPISSYFDNFLQPFSNYQSKISNHSYPAWQIVHIKMLNNPNVLSRTLNSTFHWSTFSLDFLLVIADKEEEWVAGTDGDESNLAFLVGWQEDDKEDDEFIIILSFLFFFFQSYHNSLILVFLFLIVLPHE